MVEQRVYTPYAPDKRQVVGSNPTSRTKIGLVAQWLVQGAHNALVTGSNPVGPTKLAAMVELADTRDLKSLAFERPGSSPGGGTNKKLIEEFL